jgi:predicted metal-dependent peptidase
MGEVVVAIDTSGSIGQDQINAFAGELASICSAVSPEAVRVLWWDTMVHGEQLFTPDNYDRIGALLKPLGGGGTQVSCVSRHMIKNNINAECLVVFTDGFVEDKIVWDMAVPTLWLVTANKSWRPPAGQKVFMEK